jgi:GNAT superfamily N-acetyltransferase
VTVVALIRKATATDARAIAQIYVESWNAGFGTLMPNRTLDDAEIARWASDLSAGSSRWWVALLDQNVVGFAGVGPSRDPIDPDLGECDTISVDPQHWRTGVGRVLMTQVLAGLRRAGYRAAILWTLADYHQGLRFYEAMGWKPDGGTRQDGRQVSLMQEL